MTWNPSTRTCWNQETLNLITSYDDISTTSGIFLATHTAVPLVRRTSVKPFDGGVASDEIALRKEFYEGPNVDGAMVLPIIGGVGIGKSHLIRYLFVNKPKDEKCHVVYIPKNGTNLRGAIEKILDGLDGRFDSIRESLATAQSDAPDRETATGQLLTALQQALAQRWREKSPLDNAKILSLLEKAAVLMDDAHFRSKVKDLGGPNRLVAGPLGEDEDTPDDMRIRFVAADLPFGSIDHNDLAKQSIDSYRDFASSPSAQKKFLELLNESLVRAMQTVFWSNGPRLTTLMNDVRRLLREDRKELFLLIEDFVVLSGVQGELLQALITPTIELPGAPPTLAPLRTAFAITDGPFQQMKDTLISRMRSVYAIVLSQSDDDQQLGGFGTDSQVAFLSKYLNTARYSRSELVDFENSPLGTELPSRCRTCDVSQKCHEEFGHHGEIGLYPFTSTALVTMSRTVSEKSFNPRGVIRGVLGEILTNGLQEIKQNEFPSDDITITFRNESNELDVDLAREIERKFPLDANRRKNLQQFWSPDRSKRAIWGEWTRTCFGLSDDDSVPTPKSSSTPAPVVAPLLPLELQDDYKYFNSWSLVGKAIIPEDDARFIRSSLYELITDQLHDRFGVEISKPLFASGGPADFMQRDSFVIAQSGGGRATATKPGFWTTTIDASSGNAVIFKRILQARSSGVPYKPAETMELYEFIEPMIQSAYAEYSKHFESDSTDLTRLFYLAQNFGTGTDLIGDTLVETLLMDSRLEGRGDLWKNAIIESKIVREKELGKVLAVIGTSKGNGGTLSTRAAAIRESLPPVSGEYVDKIRNLALTEFNSDQIKIAAILDLFSNQDPFKMFEEITNCLSTMAHALPGEIVSDNKLGPIFRQIDKLKENWNATLLIKRTPQDPDETVAIVARTDASELDRLKDSLDQVLTFMNEVTISANAMISSGNSTGTQAEISSTLSDLTTIMGALK